VVDSVFGMEHSHAALDRLESGEQFGKLVVHLQS
jgi:hypothetical protein